MFSGFKQVVVQSGEFWTVGRKDEHIPVKFFSFPQCQVWSVRACIITLKNDKSSHHALITESMSQFLECLNTAYCINSFLSGQEINQYVLTAIPGNFPTIFPEDVTVLTSSRDTVWFHYDSIPVFFFFWVKMVEPAFFTSNANWQFPYCHKCCSQYHTLMVSMWESPDITKFTKDVCSKTLLLCEEFNHSMLVKQCINYSHFIIVDFGQVLSHVKWPDTRFGLVNGFNGLFETNNYN